MSGGRFPVELIAQAIKNSPPIKALGERIRWYSMRPEVERLRISCKMLMGLLMISTGMMLLQSSQRSLAELRYANIRQVTPAGLARPQPPTKSFGPIWDSLMADPAVKNRWDSLLRLRPGLRDTVRELQKMDSAVSGR